MSIFKQQELFMELMKQEKDPDLYAELIREEYLDELVPAFEKYKSEQTLGSLAELTDACIDLIYVTAGLVNSIGVDGDAAFLEVQRSNLSKIPIDGKVLRREDGKVLKPDTWSPPDLLTVVVESLKSKGEL